VDEIIFSSAKQLASAIKSKKVSVIEVATEYLKHIQNVNPKINAIMQVDGERILNDAANADASISKGKQLGPLHGVPISVKDNLLTKGIITTSGSKAFASNIPSRDATVVARLKAAGAIILGKTNLPDFAMCWDTESSAYGATNNPYDLSRSAGGSSGGEAAIIAAGGSALGIANDGGGSIRLPSHYCGIAGYRPSIGLVPTTGIFPSAEGGFATGVAGRVLSVGPMARFVEDLIYCLPIIAGCDGQDPNIYDYPLLPLAEDISLNGLRIVYYQDAFTLSTSHINLSIKNIANLLSESVSIVNECTPPGVTESWNLFGGLLCADGSEGTHTILEAALKVTHLTPNCNSALKLFSNKNYSINEFRALWVEWDEYRSKLIKFMNDYDIIICPVASFPALPQKKLFTDSENFSSENYLAAYSLMGWPCVVVRAGTSEEGLPIGVQIIAKHWCDSSALKVAQYIERTLGGWQPPNLVLKNL
jgi:amidase